MDASPSCEVKASQGIGGRKPMRSNASVPSQGNVFRTSSCDRTSRLGDAGSGKVLREFDGKQDLERPAETAC